MNAPGVMEITTVIGCKIQCTYCPQSRLVPKYAKLSRQFIMPLDVFQRCVDKLPKSVEIHFSGMTEPWLNSRCTDMVLYAYGKGHPISVYTTLVGMTASDFDRIKQVPFTSFVVHIPDGDNRTRIPVTGELLDLLVYVTQFFNGSPMRHRYAASCHGSIHPAVVAAIGEDAFDSQRLFTQMMDRAGNLGNPELPHQFREGPLMCGRSATLEHNVLLPNGDVLLCCQDYSAEHVLGNLLAGDYQSILTSRETSRVLRLQSMSEHGQEDFICRHCNYAIPRETGNRRLIAMKLWRSGPNGPSRKNEEHS